MPLLVLWHFWGCFASFASLCGSKDTRPYFEDGNCGEKKAYFGRYIDGWGSFWGPSKGLEGRKRWHDIIPHRLLKKGNLGTKLVT